MSKWKGIFMSFILSILLAVITYFFLGNVVFGDSNIEVQSKYLMVLPLVIILFAHIYMRIIKGRATRVKNIIMALTLALFFEMLSVQSESFLRNILIIFYNFLGNPFSFNIFAFIVISGFTMLVLEIFRGKIIKEIILSIPVFLVLAPVINQYLHPIVSAILVTYLVLISLKFEPEETSKEKAVFVPIEKKSPNLNLEKKVENLEQMRQIKNPSSNNIPTGIIGMVEGYRIVTKKVGQNGGGMSKIGQKGVVHIIDIVNKTRHDFKFSMNRFYFSVHFNKNRVYVFQTSGKRLNQAYAISYSLDNYLNNIIFKKPKKVFRINPIAVIVVTAFIGFLVYFISNR